MSQRRFTSDLHLGHDFVAKLRGYDSTDAHDQAIIDAWTRTVSKKDTVYVLGDLATSRADHALDIIESLPGRKELISGNHDGCHPMHSNAPSQQRKYFRAFDSVSSGASLKMSGQRVLLAHLPYERAREDERERKYDQWRMPDLGLRLLCGHVHDQWMLRRNQFNVGVDHNPAPWSESEIHKWLTAPLVGDVRDQLAEVLGGRDLSRGAAQERVLQYCSSAEDGLPWLAELATRMNVLTRDMVTGPTVIAELEDQQDRSWS